MLRGGKEGLTLPSGNVTKAKTMAIKSQSSSQIPSFPGLLRHRTEPLPQQPLTGQGSAAFGPTRHFLPSPKGAHGPGGRRQMGRCGIGVGKGATDTRA